MKVLVIDEWLPWPLENGKKIRTYNLLSRLTSEHEIHLIAYTDDSPNEREKRQHLESVGIRVVPVKDTRIQKWTPKYYAKVLLNLLSSEPFSSVYHIKPAFINKLKGAVETIKPDLIHCEWTNLAPFLNYVTDIPSVISSHNVESDIWKRFAQASKNPVTKIIARDQARKIENLERFWYPKADHCIAVSEADGKIIEGYGAKVTVVDNGVDIDYYDIKSGNVDENMIIFVASYETFSNQDAAYFFLEDVFPELHRKLPAIHVWFVGKDPPNRLKNYETRYPAVHVTGTVPDVRDYLSKAALCFVPLRIAGGSRLKILEAMAIRKAVISTSIGAEGLKIKNKENIILADTPVEFSQKIEDLLFNKQLRMNIANSAWDLVKNQYDWPVLAKIMNNVWIDVLKN